MSAIVAVCAPFGASAETPHVYLIVRSSSPTAGTADVGALEAELAEPCGVRTTTSAAPLEVVVRGFTDSGDSGYLVEFAPDRKSVAVLRRRDGTRVSRKLSAPGGASAYTLALVTAELIGLLRAEKALSSEPPVQEGGSIGLALRAGLAVTDALSGSISFAPALAVLGEWQGQRSFVMAGFVLRGLVSSSSENAGTEIRHRWVDALVRLGLGLRRDRLSGAIFLDGGVMVLSAEALEGSRIVGDSQRTAPLFGLGGELGVGLGGPAALVGEVGVAWNTSPTDYLVQMMPQVSERQVRVTGTLHLQWKFE